MRTGRSILKACGGPPNFCVISADRIGSARSTNALRLFSAEVLVPQAPSLTHRAATELYRGGFNSPASQPTASVFIGSTGKNATSVHPQVEHSKVRSSIPLWPGEMRANAIRCLHTGHIGRSLVEAVIPEPLEEWTMILSEARVFSFCSFCAPAPRASRNESHRPRLIPQFRARMRSLRGCGLQENA